MNLPAQSLFWPSRLDIASKYCLVPQHMTVFTPRSRMISVRLSEDEYSSLKRLCLVTGARSVSDLTRDAMKVILNSARQNILVDQADEFRTQMAMLNKKLEELSEQIASSDLKAKS